MTLMTRLYTHDAPIIQSLQGVVAQGKKLEKTVYVFSVEADSGKVVHVNYVSDALKTKGLNARTWATKVSEIVGGKVSDLLALMLHSPNG